MENGGDLTGKIITEEDVISKLKDDGDFDRLRIKIVRKLKENEELRNSLMSIVKESVALNRLGAENMKPRQLSDAIHQEVGDKVMSQISDGVWNIIRSPDGMKAEIRETVQLVYNKLSNPKGNECVECADVRTSPVGFENAATVNAPANEAEKAVSDNQSNEPPGFISGDLHTKNEQVPTDGQHLMSPDTKPAEVQKINQLYEDDVPVPDGLDPVAPPGFSAVLKEGQICGDSDEDPDLPPGFG